MLPMTRLTSFASLVVLAACSTPQKTREASAPTPAPAAASSAAERAWTKTFEERAVLAARELELVGPPGLLEHVVITRDPSNHSHEESVTEAGLRIEERQLADSDGSPIRAQLDNLVLSADVSLVVLESPASGQVEVRARGDGYFHVLATGEEKRANSLRLVGAP